MVDADVELGKPAPAPEKKQPITRLGRIAAGIPRKETPLPRPPEAKPFGKITIGAENTLVWTHTTDTGEQRVIFRPARFFKPEKHGVGHVVEARNEGTKQLKQLFGPEPTELTVRGDEFNIKQEAAPDISDYDAKRQVTSAIARALEGAEGTMQFTLPKGENNVAVTTITKDDSRLIVERKTLVTRKERKTVASPIPGAPERIAEFPFARQVVSIRWMPESRVKAFLAEQQKAVKGLGEVGLTQEKAKQELEKRRKREAQRE